MYSDISIRIIASCESNMNSARARASSVLPTPVGPRNRKLPIGRSGSCRPARERRSAVATASIASSWPTTRSCRRSSMCTSFSVSPSIRRLTGMPVQRATTSAMSSASTSSLRNTGASAPPPELDPPLHPPPLDLVDLGRHGVDLDADLRGGLVDQVDRLVGQEAVGDVAVGERRRGDQGAVLDRDFVVHLVAFLEPPQDRDRVLNGGLAHVHGLEAPLQGG